MSSIPATPKRDRWAHLRFAIVGPLLAAPPEPSKRAKQTRGQPLIDAYDARDRLIPAAAAATAQRKQDDLDRQHRLLESAGAAASECASAPLAPPRLLDHGGSHELTTCNAERERLRRADR
ncbi:MAG: hypothetical protein WA191_06075 [Telluria sp.]